ncbi:hypothetical protein VE03_00658 [Pseudogymnoascus sp. 23342-1-I1]|nr:hypothetical protein VE03_00658 [Pseudogymnoascus sp. 23342-1-I1]
MSGVEVIGLILGGLPLIISAAKHYKKGFEPLARWKRFRFVFREFIDSVDIQRQMFQLVLKKLLIRVQLDPEEKQRLLTIPDYEGWRRSDVVEALRLRLGDSYEACMGILRTMNEDMVDLKVMMSLKDGSVDWVAPGENQWKYQAKRIQLSFSENGTRTVQSLEKKIRDLVNLIDLLDSTNDTLEGMKAIPKDTSWGKFKLRLMPKSRPRKSLRFVSDLPVEPTNAEHAKPCPDASQQNCLVTPPFLAKDGIDVNIKINDLCSTLKGLDPDVEFLGYLSDNAHQEHEVRCIKDTQNVPPSLGEVSLEKLLTSNDHLKLSRQKRYKIASIVASSLLQLQSTPWLAEKLEKKHILFYYQGSDILAEEPYISHNFVALKPGDSVPQEPKTTEVLRIHPRKTLSSLGILLLELCFGEAIENQQSLRKVHLSSDGKALDGTDFLCAIDWLVAEEEPKMAPIIKWCIFCLFEGKPNWEDTTFTQAVYACVVQPLEMLIAPT